MNNILIKKLKSAIDSSHPIEAVNEIINEYDELIKLAEWRNNVLEKGTSLKRNQKELNRIAKMIEESGYHISICENDIEKNVRNYFRDM